MSFVLRSRSRRGSVLMEFIIVAPLYFALLGGLFFVGELGLNRIRLHVGEHTGTWLGGTLRSADSPIGLHLRKDLFKDTMELVGEIRVDRDEYNRANAVNNFVALFKGGMRDLKVSMPDWARGMLFMQQAMGDGDTTDLTTKKTYAYFEGAKDVYRSFSFHRFTNGEEGRGWNALSAEQLVTDGELSTIVADTWICSDEGYAAVADKKPDAVGQKTYGRQLYAFTE